MIMRHVHSGVPGVEVDADVINPAGEAARRLERLVIIDVLGRNHVEGRNHAIVAIETEVRPERHGVRLDENDAEARKELWEVHEIAEPLVSIPFGGLQLIWRRADDKSAGDRRKGWIQAAQRSREL